MKEALLGQVLKLEDAFREHDRIAGVDLPESIRMAVLSRCVTGQLRLHLQMQMTDTMSYGELRENILRWGRATVRWDRESADSNLTNQPSQDPDNMEVDRVAQKGKGKGKGDAKGKGKGKSKSGKGAGGGKAGTQNSSSWQSQMQQSPKGGEHQTKGFNAKGKGKDGKGKQQGVSQGTCFVCGKPGHHAKQCWHNATRQISQVDADNSAAAFQINNQSQQTQQTQSSNASATSTANRQTTSFRVNRVAHEPEFAFDNCMIFDLSNDLDEEEFGMCRVVSVGSHVQHFDISDEQNCEVEPADICTLNLEAEQHVEHDDVGSTQCFDFHEGCDGGYFSAVSYCHGEPDHGYFSVMEEDAAMSMEEDLRVHAVCDETKQLPGDEGGWIDIVIDSGADASMLPLHFGHSGSKVNGGKISLLDAQGGFIDIKGQRESQIELEGSNNARPILVERAFVGNVNQPLISFGKMLTKNWNITSNAGEYALEHGSGIQVPIKLCGRSLTVQGRIRAVREEQIDVALSDELLHLPQGWSELRTGFPVFWGFSLEYAEPSLNFPTDEWFRRTTLMYQNGKWNLFEFCDKITPQQPGELMNPALDKEVVVILSKGYADPEQMGFSISKMPYDTSEPQAPQAPPKEQASSSVGHAHAFLLTFSTLQHGNLEESNKEDANSLICMAVVCSQTGFSQAIPIENKQRSLKYLTAELTRFITVLGHGEVSLRTDAEPFALKLQAQVQKARRIQGFRTLIDNAKVKDSQSNALVENSIHRLRQQANVLLHQARQRIGLMLDHKHCLMAWAMVRSGFLLNRFVTKAGSTPFELVSGKPFSGRLAMFAEPVMAFVATKETPKGDARWERSIVLTKAGMTDMYLVFCKGRIRLTRSIRRCFADWKDALELFTHCNAFPWQLEGVLGAKLQPSITKPGEKPEAIEPLPFAGALADTSAGDEAAEDPKSDKGNEPSEDSVTPSSRASMEMDAQQAGNLQVPAIAASSAGQSAAVLPDTATLEELFLVDRNLEESPKRMRLDETGKATNEKSGRIGRLAHLDYDEFEALDGEELDAELFDRPEYLQDADEKFVILLIIMMNHPCV